jgi:hypothetical protein
VASVESQGERGPTYRAPHRNEADGRVAGRADRNDGRGDREAEDEHRSQSGVDVASPRKLGAWRGDRVSVDECGAGRHQTDSQLSWTGATLRRRVQPALQDRHRPATANPDPPHDCIDGLPSEQLATHVGH